MSTSIKRNRPEGQRPVVRVLQTSISTPSPSTGKRSKPAVGRSWTSLRTMLPPRPFDYVPTPAAASALFQTSGTSLPHPNPKSDGGRGLLRSVSTSPEPSSEPHLSSPQSRRHSLPPAASGGTFTSHILSQVLNVPSSPSQPPTSDSETIPANIGSLLTSRDPLSLPITTVNFRRFVARSGATFWFLDRCEEILFWKRGSFYTLAFLSGYVFLCLFPHMLLVLPAASLIALSLSQGNTPQKDAPPPFPSHLPPEASAQWFANIQAIQNVLGAYSDGYDVIASMTPYLSPTPQLISGLVLYCFAILVLSLFVPSCVLFLVIGLTPFVLTHPLIKSILSMLLSASSKSLRSAAQQFLDNDRLEDSHWLNNSKALRKVEVWENERWGGNPPSWGKVDHLKETDRAGWTRGADGWSGITNSENHVSSLTFLLEPNWAFVETEDWRCDLDAAWASYASDEDGWSYSNDAWQYFESQPLETWYSSGTTRRRRWTRRIYYNGNNTVD